MSKSTNKRNERISAFLDNELHSDELMSFSLSAEEHDDAAIAQRYQMVGDALRGEMSEASFIDVSHGVRQALANENISDQVTSFQSDVPSEQSGWMANLLAAANGFRPAAGMAVATLVAVVMVVTLSQQDTETLTPIANNTNAAPMLLNVASEDKAKQIDPQVDQRLVNQHLEFATQDALQGRLPYVRAVSYETIDNLK